MTDTLHSVHWFCKDVYRIYSKYLDKHACANSVDPDQTPQNAASDQALNHLSITQHVRQINK